MEEGPLPFARQPCNAQLRPSPSDIEDGQARSPLQTEAGDGRRDCAPGPGECQRAGLAAPRATEGAPAGVEAALTALTTSLAASRLAAVITAPVTLSACRRLYLRRSPSLIAAPPRAYHSGSGALLHSPGGVTIGGQRPPTRGATVGRIPRQGRPHCPPQALCAWVGQVSTGWCSLNVNWLQT